MSLGTFFFFVLPLLLSNVSEASLPPNWQPGFDAAYRTLENNLQAPSESLPFYSAHPSPKFSEIYLWDSAFISIIWKYRDPKIAEDIILSVLHGQQPDGRVPHAVGFFGPSNITQPPLLSYAANDILAKKMDMDFVRTIYPKLKKYHEWLWDNRRLPNGLFFWSQPYESGIDNSPRFGNRDESHFDDTTKLAAIDFSSYAVLDAESLAKLAKLQFDNSANPAERASLEEDALLFTEQAAIVAQAVRDLLWDETTGYFYDLNVQTNKYVRIPTIASFFPLIAGIATEQQWQTMREHLSNTAEFNTPTPFPTVARNNAAFEKDCWRGPVWINTAYLTIRGMQRYHGDELANAMAYRLVDNVYQTAKNTGKFVEFYDPERDDFTELTRKRGLGPLGLLKYGNLFSDIGYFFGKELYLGEKPIDHFVGWTGLVNNLAIELTQ
jgi:glycogen debranching enzyme